MSTTKDQSWIVYLLECADGAIYTGCTSDLDDRIARHLKGQITFTKTRLPVQLVTYVTFNCRYRAFAFEKYLKTGSGRAFAKRHLYQCVGRTNS